MTMIAQGKIKSVVDRKYRPRRERKEKDTINTLKEKLVEFIPANDQQILEDYKKLQSQLDSLDGIREKQFWQHLQEALKTFKLDEPQKAGKILEIVKSLLQSYTIRLNSSDVKILEAIYRQPLLTLEGICSATKLSWGTVQKRYNQLAGSQVYKTVAVPNYDKLGLAPIIVLTLDSEREILSPYLTSIQINNGWCSTNRLWEILIPKSNLQEFAKLIFRHLQNSRIFEKLFLLHSVNFTYFDRGSRSWNINWSQWELELEKEETVKVILDHENCHKKQRIKRMDLKILHFLTQNLRREQREIAQALNTSESKVSLCKKNLYNDKYFTPVLQLTNRAGLTENLLIILKEKIQEIPSAFLKLPQTTIYELTEYSSKTKQTIIQTQLPPGSKTRIKEILERKSPDTQFSNYTIQIESFPETITEAFDEKNQNWMWGPPALKIYHKINRNLESPYYQIPKI